MTTLEIAVENGKQLGKMALYFGCWEHAGHFLHDIYGKHLWDHDLPADLPWSDGLMDGTLLKNGKVPDVPFL